MRLLFQNLSYKMKYVFHIFLSLSFIYIGEYSYSILIQFAFLLSFYKKLFYFLYLPLASIALVVFFTVMAYKLYFLNLILILYFLYKEGFSFNNQKIIYLIFFSTIFYFLYLGLEDFRYELYIYSAINDTVHYYNVLIVCFLTIFHIFLAYFINFKK